MSASTIDFNQRVVVPDFVLFRELDGEAVLLNLNDESYFGLDDVGTRMWSVLQESLTIADAFERLRAEYDVDAGQLQGDLIELIQTLAAHGLVQIQSGQ